MHRGQNKTDTRLKRDQFAWNGEKSALERRGSEKDGEARVPREKKTPPS